MNKMNHAHPENHGILSKLTLTQRGLRGVCDVRIIIINQTCNDLRDTRTADLPQRIKGRNANVVKLVRFNHFLKSLDAALIPATTKSSRAEVTNPNLFIGKPFDQPRDRLRSVHIRERTSRSRTNVRRFVFQCMSENIESPFIFDKRQVLDRRTAYSLIFISTQLYQRASRIRITKVSGNLHRRFANVRI